jgi:hypothetical protein
MKGLWTERRLIMSDNTIAWEMLRTVLTSFLSRDPTQFRGLQMVTAPLDALWDNPSWAHG